MLGANEQRCEVARLLAQFGAEYQAGHDVLHGRATGPYQYESLIARMNAMGMTQAQLQGLVGENAARAMIADQLNQPQ